MFRLFCFDVATKRPMENSHRTPSAEQKQFVRVFFSRDGKKCDPFAQVRRGYYSFRAASGKGASDGRAVLGNSHHFQGQLLATE